MMEIYITLLLMAGLFSIRMARRGRGRRAYQRGAIEEELLLSTLAGKTLIAESMDSTVDNTTWVSSVDVTWSLGNLTKAFSVGPIVVGVAHNAYTAAQIEEWVEQTNSWNQSDLAAQEIAGRKIRLVGTFEEATSALGIVTLNDGKPIHTKCGFLLQEGQTLAYWAYNLGSTALSTTSAELTLAGHANLWPR